MSSGFDRRPNDPTAASGSAPSPPAPRCTPDPAAQTEEIRRTERPAQLNFAAGARPLPPSAHPIGGPVSDLESAATQEFAAAARSDAPPNPAVPQNDSLPVPTWQSAATTPFLRQSAQPTDPVRPVPEQSWQSAESTAAVPNPAWQSAAPESTAAVANPAWQSAAPDSAAAVPNPVWQGYGPQHPPTSTFEVPPYGAPPGVRRNRTAWVFAGVGAVVVVALAVTVAMIVSGRNSRDPEAQAGSPSMVSALTSGKSTPSPTGAAPAPPRPSAGPVAPVVPGFQVVSIPERGAAYDVPRDWKIDPVGTAVWGEPPDTVELAGLAQDGENYCPSYTRTNAFLTLSPRGDPAAAAADVGARMAKAGWSAAATAGAAEPLDSLDGQLHGAFVETTGSAPPPAPGCATTFAVYTFAFPSENGNFVMTIAADTGVDKAVDKTTAKRVLTSIRPLPNR
ncbi:hypothetical protein [Nocardia wallacei]|uniref:hypothetical protein n=1 Tax=Nocardia wallacei TaxID=480035 RepID=UPI00245387EF|nr:hypothetical protein [Nocardia wallacei]